MIEGIGSRRRSPFWQLVTRFDSSRLAPVIAARNTLGVLVALGAGIAAGSPLGGVAAASGALLASYSDTDEPYRRRAQRMLVASTAMALAIVAGALSGRHPVLAIAGAAAAAFAAGMAVAFGPTVTEVSIISLVMLITYSAQPLSAVDALGAGALAFAGALLQTTLSLALWPVRRDDPERRALGGLYLEIARMATEPVASVESPPATAAITRVQQMLRGAPDENPRTERHRSLLVQAERMRLAILTLRRLHWRLEQQPSPAPDALRRYLDGTRLVVGAIAEALLTGTAPPWLADRLREAQRMADEWRRDEETRAAAGALALDVRLQMDALNGQLRAAADLAASVGRTSWTAAAAGPLPIAAAPRRRSRSPLGVISTVRANLSFRSATFRHAVRLAGAVGIAELLAQVIEWRRAYWIPMTVAIVLKPDFAGTFSRGVLRIAGTLVGLLLATALFHVFPPSTVVQAALLGVFVFVLRWAGAANYGVFTIAVSAVIVLLIALTGVAPGETIMARGLDTSLGGVVALVAYALWPTWERHRVGDVLADLLRGYRDYFEVVVQARTGPAAAAARELDATLDGRRLAARLARTNLEASLERLRTEPGTAAARLELLQRIMASSHRFAHAAMALEAAPHAGGDGDGPGLARFADAVDTTLGVLASAVQDDHALAPGDLPDLREAVHALVTADAGGGRPPSLVHAEADRIANSLNTLAEQILLWRSSSQTW